MKTITKNDNKTKLTPEEKPTTVRDVRTQNDETIRTYKTTSDKQKRKTRQPSTRTTNYK